MSGRRSEPGDGTRELTPAVVLRTRSLREADLVVILLTPGNGKLDCIARGARRSRRRFPGGLPVGARGEAALGRGRGSLVPLEHFAAGFDHSGLGRDLEGFAYVNYLCELTDRLVEGSGADPASFALLCEAIETVISGGACEGGGSTRPAILRRFELGLLEGLGLLPALDRCGVCGSPVLASIGVDGRGVPFSVSRGGALCLAHSRAAGGIPAPVLALARVLLHEDEDGRRAAYEAASAQTRRGLRDLCRELIAPHLRAPLRSLAFFTQLPRSGIPSGS
ncbi:DNA repair protein RecO [Pseudenhygromyxa sp. WMMC2535]|uniref:DNA repair protein RecO n=1 Tax=Pseudenhygromyxa sp. WMMC2535 TaxID=2712867 RepID=UPI001555FA59|nr:DNA repair protein RecO [Pseudenhygromyxa sp. WMMC2535]NVB41930.1 DNA repair protein RecO [Pseudenhygromyxa sp. WMMC2535]